MQKWEYTMFYKFLKGEGMLFSATSASRLWDEKDKDKDGETAFDTITEYGKKGWELISVTPLATSLTGNGCTDEILFTFKRPIEE